VYQLCEGCPCQKVTRIRKVKSTYFRATCGLGLSPMNKSRCFWGWLLREVREWHTHEAKMRGKEKGRLP